MTIQFYNFALHMLMKHNGVAALKNDTDGVTLQHRSVSHKLTIHVTFVLM